MSTNQQPTAASTANAAPACPAMSTSDEDARNEPFPLKTYKMMDEVDKDHPDIAHYYTGEKHGGHGLCIVNEKTDELRHYLEKHNVCKANNGRSKFTSFVRQLNKYGFQKIQEFNDKNITLYQHINGKFRKGREDLLEDISIVKKKKSPDASATSSDLSALESNSDQKIDEVMVGWLIRVAKSIEEMKADMCALKEAVTALANGTNHQYSSPSVSTPALAAAQAIPPTLAPSQPQPPAAGVSVPAPAQASPFAPGLQHPAERSVVVPVPCAHPPAISIKVPAPAAAQPPATQAQSSIAQTVPETQPLVAGTGSPAPAPAPALAPILPQYPAQHALPGTDSSLTHGGQQPDDGAGALATTVQAPNAGATLPHAQARAMHPAQGGLPPGVSLGVQAPTQQQQHTQPGIMLHALSGQPPVTGTGARDTQREILARENGEGEENCGRKRLRTDTLPAELELTPLSACTKQEQILDFFNPTTNEDLMADLDFVLNKTIPEADSLPQPSSPTVVTNVTRESSSSISNEPSKIDLSCGNAAMTDATEAMTTDESFPSSSYGSDYDNDSAFPFRVRGGGVWRQDLDVDMSRSPGQRQQHGSGANPASSSSSASSLSLSLATRPIPEVTTTAAGNPSFSFAPARGGSYASDGATKTALSLPVTAHTTNLDNNDIGREELKALQISDAQLVPCTPSTERNNSRFKDIVLRLLRNDKSLTKIFLRKLEMTPDKAEFFASALPRNDTVTCIELWDNMFGDEGVSMIMKALCQNGTLRVLGLGQNGICKPGAFAIAMALPSTCIVSLDLENNNLGVEGAEVLAGGLCKSPTLEKLRLGGNGIKDKGVEAIAEATPLSICELYLGRNEISDKGADLLVRGLQPKKFLNLLDLSENRIRAEGAKKLADPLCCQNTSLSKLDLRGNDIGDEGGFAFEKTLRKNRVLTRVNLERCGLNNELKGSIDAFHKFIEKWKIKDDKVALFKRRQATSSIPQNITVLVSAPLFYKREDKLHRIVDSHNFEREKALIAKCVEMSRKKIDLSFDAFAEGVLLSHAEFGCGCLHISGHGYQGHLLLEDGLGGADWLEEDKIYKIVHEDSFGLVSVSGRNAVWTGDTFIKSGVKRVLCCEHDTLEDEAAMSFTYEFYSRLLRGFTIMEAFEGAKLDVQQRFDSVGEDKFILLPENSDHQICIFEGGEVENYTRTTVQDVIPSYPLHQGQAFALYQLIQLVFSHRAVNVVNSRAPEGNTLAMAASKYMSDRRNILLDIENIYYIPCNVAESNVGAENATMAKVLQNGTFCMEANTGTAHNDNNEEFWRAFFANIRESKPLIILDGFSCEGTWLLTKMMQLLADSRGIRFLIFSEKELPAPGSDKLWKAVDLHDEGSDRLWKVLDDKVSPE